MKNLLHAIAVLALTGFGCHHPEIRKFPPVFVPLTADNGCYGPGGRDLTCGYRNVRHGSEPPRREFTCWRKARQFHCDGCKEESRLACRLILPDRPRAEEALPLVVQLTNTSKTPLLIDPQGSPIGPHNLNSATLHMLCGGVVEPSDMSDELHGLNGARGPYSKYLKIAPGETIESSINLRLLYPEAQGNCLVHWHGMLWDVVEADHPPPVSEAQNRVVVRCNWAQARIAP